MVYRYRSFADRAHECMRARARCECPAVEADWGWCRDSVDPPPLIIYYGKNLSIMADISATEPFVTLTARQNRTRGYLTERLTRGSDVRNGEEASGRGGVACIRNGKGSHPVEVCFLSLCQPFRPNRWWLEYKRARLVVLLFMFLFVFISDRECR